MACDAAARFGDAVAVVDRGRRTFAELVADARRVTAALAAGGLEPGERAAVWAPNRYEWLVAALGILGAGGAVVPVNTRFKGEEVRYILDRSGARVAFTVGEFLGVDYAATLAELRSGLPNLRTVVGFDATTTADQSLAELQRTGDAVDDAIVDARIAAVGGDDVSDVLFTSGTTGAPKGVLMTHAQTLRQFSDWCDMAGLVEGDRYLIVNPFFHMFGYKAGCLASLMRGATIIPKPVFEVDDLLRTVAEESVTVFPGPPTVYQSILDHPDRDAYDLSTLRLAVTGAADIPVELIRRMHEELPFQLIVTGYGLTEAGTVTATAPDDDFETIATTVGRARPGLEIRVAGDDGADVGSGEAGELLVRGYSVMRGYLDDPDATAATIDGDGWLHTGDLATIDERGCVKIVGRIKDMFIVGGFNAYPAEIENLLLGHPAVARAAVVGMPDPRLGEVGMAFVVVAPGAQLDPDELIAWARDTMANYKVPRAVELVDELPVNAAGKVEKETLRVRAAARAEKA
jgi:acyl-CoA synthetase (AMP-forming)/AMP-acid ligase II